MEERTFAEIFERELSLISDNELREWTERMLSTNVEYQHKHAPASSSGKYHPECSNGEGGLVRHTKLVVHLVLTLLDTRPDLSKERDRLVSAAILHDMGKYHDDSRFVTHDHPAYMASLCIEEGQPEIASLIAAHMGSWNTNTHSNVVLEVPYNERRWLLHYADYIASRKWIPYTFDQSGELVKT